MFSRLTLRVTSLIKTGANLFVRRLRWTHKKLISDITTSLPLILTCTGIPEINPNNFFFCPPLTPKSHYG